MNRDTRTFIFGIMLAFMGSFGILAHLIAMYKGAWKGDGWDYVFMTCSAITLFIGAHKISKTID